jgi:hypothetical protein
VAGRDITEGRATRSIAFDVGILSGSAIWQNTDVAYDVAVGGMPFIYAINDSRPYLRQTAPFRKEQFDNQTEPGEQSLTGWWIRSQTSFHAGSGITYFDPATTDNTGHYRFYDSKGVDVWTKGQVSLLKDVTAGHITTEDVNSRPNQYLRSITWGTTAGVLMLDGYDLDKIDTSGNETHFVNYNAGSDDKVYAVCDDGTTAYWVTNVTSGGTTKLTVYKKDLTGDYTTSNTQMFQDASTIVTNAVMEFTKERIVACINNKVYEFSTSATALPTPLYTHPANSHIFTSITASGPAIYVAGYNGIQSTIIKFTLSSSGTMPTLTYGVVAAELPVGEIAYKIFYYLGYMMIGTNLGVRVAFINDQDGSINYGPLIVETDQPVYDFAARDHYVWCATSVDGEPGLIRIDLGTEVEPLRFAWANDLYYAGVSGRKTTACAFLDSTDRMAFTTNGLNVGTQITNKELTSNVATLTTSTAHGLTVGDTVWIQGVDSTFNSTSGTYTVVSVPSTTTFTYAKTASNVASTAVSASTAQVHKPGAIYIEAASNLITSGYLQTGNIRYGTLEPKNFKRLIARGDYTYGSITLETVDKDGNEYDHISYDASVPPVEVTTSSPSEAQEYVAYKFVLYRDGTDSTKGPTFKGYQAKATIATPRQRIIRFPVYCFDTETDRFNTVVGYEGRALDRILALENIEENGDVVTWQDLTTSESRQVIIEQILFTRATPPDKRFSGYGGIAEITIRTV